MAKKKSKILSTLESRKKYIESAYNSLLTEAKTDNRFYRGEQLDENAKKTLVNEGRPVVQFNHIKGQVNMLKGHQAEQRYYFKVIAADNVANDEPIEYDGQQVSMEECGRLITEELKQIEEENDGSYELSDTFGDGITSSRSYIEPFIKVDQSQFPYKYQIVFENRPYNEVFPDPDAKKYDLSDARYYFKFKEISKDDLIELFPEKEDKIMGMNKTDEWYRELKDGGDGDMTYEEAGNISTSEDKEAKDEDVVFVEYFYYKWKTSYVLVIEGTDQMGQPLSERIDVEKSEIKDREKLLDMRQKMDPSLQWKKFELKKKIWYVVSYCDGEVLDDDEGGREVVELDEIGIVQYAPDSIKALQDMHLKYLSVVRELRSPQEYLNKAKGQAMAHLNSSVHSGMAHEEGALLDEKSWENYGSSPGFRGVIKTGMWDKWKMMNPEPLSQGHMAIAEDAETEMKQISNINTDLMGGRDDTSSGRAIALRQQAGLKGIHFYFDNFRRTKHILCKKLVKLVCYLKGCDPNKLKVVVDDTAESPTVRYANWMETRELLESGAFQSPFGDLIINGMNINNREEWVGRWQESNEFAQWKQEMEMKAQAEQAAIEDARKEGLIPQEGQPGIQTQV